MPLADFIVAGAALALVAHASHAQTTVCGGDGTPIPDGSSSAAIVLSVPADTGALVEDVTVSIDLTHGWIGDLTITVSHAGESVVLVERVGSASWTFGCGGDDINAVFTDDASIVADALCTPEGPTPMLFGGILPAEALSVFSGTPVEGDWIVTVVDASAIDAGVINSVCVSVVAAPGECVGDVTGDGSVDLADLNLVLANFGQATSDGDADGSGEVDLADLNIILANFGATC